jgi:hypothetical protein
MHDAFWGERGAVDGGAGVWLLRFLLRGHSFLDPSYSMLKVRTAMAKLLEVGSERGRFDPAGRPTVVTGCHQAASIPAGPCAPLSMRKEPAKPVVIRRAASFVCHLAPWFRDRPRRAV